MSSLVTVNIPDLTDVRYGSTSVKRIMHGSRLLWSSDMLPFIRYDSLTGLYYNVTGISADNTQYIETALDPYYLVEMTGLYDFPLGVYASIDTVVELWCTRLQDWGNCTISNAWSMNDSTGTFRIFAWNDRSNVCLDFGSDNYSDSNTKGSYIYMVRLLYNARDLLDGTSGDIYHLKCGNIDNRATQIVYRNDTQVCNNQSNTLLSFYRGTDAEAQLHLYHRNTNDDFTFYKVVVRLNNEVVRNMYWKKDANDNLYLYDSVTDSAMTSTVSSGSLTYQTGKDTYTLHDDIGPVKEYYYQDGYITVNDVKYEKLVSNLDNTKIIQGTRLQPYILYENNKYYKVTDIVNNQYVKEELEPYYHGEIINCVVDYPLGISATIDTMIEVWCSQMLSKNGSAYIGTAYNDNTNGTFKLYTNGSYETATALIFKFGSSSSSTSSDTLSSTYDSFSYTCGRYYNTNSLISGSTNYVYYIKAGSINGYNGLVVEHSSQYNYNSVKTTPIQSFYQGTDEQSQLHLNFTTMGCQIKMYKLRVWHGNTIVRDLRFRFKNNTKTDANMYLWDDVSQSEITPVGTTNIKYYSSSSGLADIYTLVHDDKFSNYYTVNGTITVNGVTYERLVNSIDSTKIIKGIQIGTIPDTPTLANPVITLDDLNYSINMSCSTSGALIYYTIDGTEPDYNISFATLYNSPIDGFELWDEMDANGYYIIKAQSYLNGTWSEVVEFDMSEL